jgi:hypothetical protein
LHHELSDHFGLTVRFLGPDRESLRQAGVVAVPDVRGELLQQQPAFFERPDGDPHGLFDAFTDRGNEAVAE